MTSSQTYQTAAAARKLKVSKQSLLRWIAQGRVDDVRRDHRGWRIFDEADIKRIRRKIYGE